jgi:hypothetical protein
LHLNIIDSIHIIYNFNKVNKDNFFYMYGIYQLFKYLNYNCNNQLTSVVYRKSDDTIYMLIDIWYVIRAF